MVGIEQIDRSLPIDLKSPVHHKSKFDLKGEETGQIGVVKEFDSEEAATDHSR